MIAMPRGSMTLDAVLRKACHRIIEVGRPRIHHWPIPHCASSLRGRPRSTDSSRGVRSHPSRDAHVGPTALISPASRASPLLASGQVSRSYVSLNDRGAVPRLGPPGLRTCHEVTCRGAQLLVVERLPAPGPRQRGGFLGTSTVRNWFLGVGTPVRVLLRARRPPPRRRHRVPRR